MDSLISKYGSKFIRGQVWFIKKDKQKEYRKMKDPDYYLTCKTRPWVIISDTEEGNQMILTLLPLSESLKESYPCKVTINLLNVITSVKCDEPTTVNYEYLRKNGTYLATLSDNTMDQIMETFSKRFKITFKENNKSNRKDTTKLKRKESSFDKIPNKFIIKSSELEDDIKPVGKINSNIIKPKTKEEKVEFLKFLDTYGIDMTMKKYNCGNSTVYYRKNKFLKEVSTV